MAEDAFFVERLAALAGEVGGQPALARHAGMQRRHAGRLLLANRRRVLVPKSSTVLHRWKMVHVPFTFLMALLSAIHIVVALTYSM